MFRQVCCLFCLVVNYTRIEQPWLSYLVPPFPWLLRPGSLAVLPNFPSSRKLGGTKSARQSHPLAIADAVFGRPRVVGAWTHVAVIWQVSKEKVKTILQPGYIGNIPQLIYGLWIPHSWFPVTIGDVYCIPLVGWWLVDKHQKIKILYIYLFIYWFMYLLIYCGKLHTHSPERAPLLFRKGFFYRMPPGG